MMRCLPSLLLLKLQFVGLLALPLAAAPTAEVLEGLVVRVADGDTLDVLDAGRRTLRVRMLGIDAPEGGQAYGKVARQVLKDRVIQRRVTVRVQERDRYGRLVGKVLLEGVDLNLELVREGMAWHYEHYAKDQFPGDAAAYASAQREARAARRGLWNQPGPQAPWEWRRAHPRN
jgi:endonuclease YncB( thermonuclease family)